MGVTVRERDRGADALMRRMRQQANVRVGVMGQEASAGHAGGLTVVDVASFHEFGLGHNPPRSFIAGYVDENKATIEKRIRKAAELIAKGADVKQTLDRFGLLLVGEIQERMVSLPPPLKPETIRRKGSSATLIDTGQLRSSVTHETRVERRRG